MEPTPVPRRGEVADALAALLAPARCWSCRRRGPAPWCEHCARDVTPLPPGCRRCAGPAGPGHPCWPASAPVSSTVAAFDYRGSVAAAIVNAKMAGATAGWVPLGRHLGRLLHGERDRFDVVTFVTTPARRVRSRGVDHAARLARAVAEEIELPARRLLDARTGPRGGDRYRPRHRLPGTNLLIVDDVLTTGATAWRVAAHLRAAGAGEVGLAVVARAGAHPLGPATW